MNLMEKLLVLKSTSVLYFGIVMRIYYSKENTKVMIFRKDLIPNCCRIFQTQSERTNERRIICIEGIQKFLLLLLFVQVLSSFEYNSFYFNIIFIEFSACFNINSIYLIPIHFNEVFFKSYITKSLIGTLP